MIGWEAELNLDIKISHLPLWQYKELLNLKNHSPFSSAIIENTDQNISRKQELNGKLNIPQVEEPEYWDLLNFAWRAGLAANVELLYPIFLYEEAVDVLEEYKEQNLIRKRAKNCLQDLAVATSDRILTEVTAAILDPQKRVEDGYKVIDSTVVREIPGAYNFEFENEEIQGWSIDDNYINEFERQDPGHLDAIGLMLVEEPEDEVYAKITSNGLEVLDELTHVQNPKDAISCITINREHGIATHWYWFDRLKIQIYSGIPSHASGKIDQLYSGK